MPLTGTLRAACWCEPTGTGVKLAITDPHPPMFLYVWQGKDLREGIFVCVAGKGVTGAFSVCVAGKRLRDLINAEPQRTQSLEGADGSGHDLLK